MKKVFPIVLLAVFIAAVAFASAQTNGSDFSANATQCEKSYKWEYDNCIISYNTAVEGQNKNAVEINRLFQELNKCNSLLTPQYGNLQPSDKVAERQISISGNTASISYQDIYLSRVVKNTGSMRPAISDTSHVIFTKQFTADSINIGDIVSFEKNFFDGTATHRVIDKKFENGIWHFKTKGDNNTYDDGWIEFSKIKGVAVAVIY